MRVYADNAATTQISKKALDSMMPYLTEQYWNPSAVYSGGAAVKTAKEKARADTAKCIGAMPNELFFTSGGTESDNWAFHGAAELRRGRENCRHIITSTAEHSAVLNTAVSYEKAGYEVTYLTPDKYGRITPQQLAAAVRPDTFFVSLMSGNNEVGTLLPVRELCRAARSVKKDILFHTDAVQSAGHIPIDVRSLGVDFLSLSSHKFRGPKGTGALFVRLGLVLPPLLFGGGQEKGRRSGTENTAGVIGMAAALKDACENMQANTVYITRLRDMLTEGILESIPGAQLTGDPKERLPGSASFVFEGIADQPIIAKLDEDFGIWASQGSACSAGSGDPSRVLLAMGYDDSLARGSLRLTLGEQNTEDEINYILNSLPQTVEMLRKRKRQIP